MATIRVPILENFTSHELSISSSLSLRSKAKVGEGRGEGSPPRFMVPMRVHALENLPSHEPGFHHGDTEVEWICSFSPCLGVFVVIPNALFMVPMRVRNPEIPAPHEPTSCR